MANDMTTVGHEGGGVSPFDAIREVGADGVERWSARKLMPLLGYKKWQVFAEVVARAEAACRNSGHEPSEHFTSARKTQMSRNQHGPIEVEVKDTHLSRYACYLTAMNGDPHKSEIAAAQAYFAIQTRRAEKQQEAQQETALAILARSIERFASVVEDRLTRLESRNSEQELRPFAGWFAMRERINEILEAHELSKIGDKWKDRVRRDVLTQCADLGIELKQRGAGPIEMPIEHLRWLELIVMKHIRQYRAIQSHNDELQRWATEHNTRAQETPK